jgi:hypothetical protein
VSYENTHIDEDDQQRIHALFVGRKVAKVADDRLLLDDGTELRVVPNVGGCSCGAGDYELKSLNGCDNVITRAEVVEEPLEEFEGERTEDGHRYTLFVYADNQRINLATIEGDDGNGYYGTGFQVVVTSNEGSW